LAGLRLCTAARHGHATICGHRTLSHTHTHTKRALGTRNRGSTKLPIPVHVQRRLKALRGKLARARPLQKSKLPASAALPADPPQKHRAWRLRSREMRPVGPRHLLETSDATFQACGLTGAQGTNSLEVGLRLDETRTFAGTSLAQDSQEGYGTWVETLPKLWKARLR